MGASNIIIIIFGLGMIVSEALMLLGIRVQTFEYVEYTDEEGGRHLAHDNFDLDIFGYDYGVIWRRNSDMCGPNWFWVGGLYNGWCNTYGLISCYWRYIAREEFVDKGFLCIVA